MSTLASLIVPRLLAARPLVAPLALLAAVFTLAACEVMPVALEEPIVVRVQGRVTDAETGAPIDSASVFITSGPLLIDEEVHASTTTDAAGRYEISRRFENECPGDLRIGVFVDLDYQTDRVDLECTSGTRRVNFELTRRAGAEGSSDPVR